jgi:hypothetical protein
MIKLVTTPEAELDRLRLGVGLPARSAFYGSTTGVADAQISPYFSMDLKKIGKLLARDSNKTFRRSDLRCYFEFSKILTFHLKRIIEIPDGPRGKDSTVEERIRDIFKGLLERLDFVRDESNCKFCHMHCAGP